MNLKHLSDFSGILIMVTLLLSGCEKDPAINITKAKGKQQYIFLGHIYQNSTEIDERVAALPPDQYDQIWLGGDICAETTEKSSTVDYIDNIFDLDSKNTHWTLGNHDIRNGNINWITAKTKRPTYYASFHEGITILVLNTTLGYGGNYDTVKVNDQFDLIQNVCDTIITSSHLILLTHHVVWNGVDNISNAGEYANGDNSGFRFHFDPDLNYKDGVYPLLQEVSNRGIQVLHIAGDLGQKTTSYQKLTSDSIQFLGSGITSNTAYNEQFPTAGKPDSILLLDHDISNKKLTWTFKELK